MLKPHLYLKIKHNAGIMISKNIILMDDGLTRLGGRNVGKYPIHHFVRNVAFGNDPGWPLKLIFIGDDEWVRGCYRFRENSHVFAVEFVRDGSFIFVQDGRRHLVKPGEVFLVHPGKNNEMYTEDTIAFKKVMMAGGESLSSILLSLGLDKLDVVRPESPERLLELFEHAESSLKKAGPDFMSETSRIVYETLLCLGAKSNSKRLPDALKEALSFLQANINGRVSIESLCRHCGCSSMTLLRLFKRHLDSSPIEHFIGMKMALAREMLSASSQPVKEISRQLGYSSQLHFSAEFKKRNGLSPRNYRTKLKSDAT